MISLFRTKLGADGFDLNDRKLLTVSPLLVIAFALLFLKNDDLYAAFIFQYFGGNFGTLKLRVSKLEVSAFTSGQNVRNLNSSTGFRVWIPIDSQDVALAYGELLALGFDGRFHV